MRYIILILFPILAIASWVSSPNSQTVYPTQDWCERESGTQCYEVPAGELHTNCKIEEYDIQGAPIYASRTDETDCIISDPPEHATNWSYPENDCRYLVRMENNEPVLCTDKSYFAIYAQKSDFNLGDGYFAYCTKITGYESVGKAKRLVIDEEKKAQTLIEQKRKENIAAKEAFIKQKEEEAEVAIKAALKQATGEEADYTTHLMYLVSALNTKINPNASEAEKQAAESLINTYNPVFTQIQTIRANRDTAINSFIPPHTDINPLY